MKDIQKQFQKETNEPITIIGEFNNSKYPIVKVDVEIWNPKYIAWLETILSERQSSTEVSEQHDSKALHIADVSGCFSVEIDFGGNVKARLKVCNNTVTVTDSMNGYGDAIAPENIDIVYLK